MMKIREFQTKDLEKLVALAEQHKINIPGYGKIFIAEDNENKIVGFSLVREVMMIEPFICTNPLTAVKLFNKTIDHLKENKVEFVKCFALPERKELYKKLGFIEVFNNYSIMEKEIKNV